MNYRSTKSPSHPVLTIPLDARTRDLQQALFNLSTIRAEGNNCRRSGRRLQTNARNCDIRFLGDVPIIHYRCINGYVDR